MTITELRERMGEIESLLRQLELRRYIVVTRRGKNVAVIVDIKYWRDVMDTLRRATRGGGS